MTALYAIGATFLVLLVAAHTRIMAMLFGQSVSVPVLGILAVAVFLFAFAAVLVLLRQIIREGLHLRPVPVVRP